MRCLLLPIPVLQKTGFRKLFMTLRMITPTLKLRSMKASERNWKVCLMTGDWISAFTAIRAALSLIETGLGVGIMNELITRRHSANIVRLPIEPGEEMELSVAIPSLDDYSALWEHPGRNSEHADRT